ncbi:DUF1661 domain-containing protein [Porphyromonas gulae]
MRDFFNSRTKTKIFSDHVLVHVTRLTVYLLFDLS